jgi:hypothetical protein
MSLTGSSEIETQSRRGAFGVMPIEAGITGRNPGQTLESVGQSLTLGDYHETRPLDSVKHGMGDFQPKRMAGWKFRQVFIGSPPEFFEVRGHAAVLTPGDSLSQRALHGSQAVRYHALLPIRIV